MQTTVINGTTIIDEICKQLEIKQIPPTDSAIVQQLNDTLITLSDEHGINFSYKV